jgi:hypothetical protein
MLPNAMKKASICFLMNNLTSIATFLKAILHIESP